MGRMADARKRARGKSGGGDSIPPEPETPATTDAVAPPPDVPLDEPTEVSAPPRPAPRAEPSWVSRAENRRPRRPAGRAASQRLALPSSGLAEDILAPPRRRPSRRASTVRPSRWPARRAGRDAARPQHLVLRRARARGAQGGRGHRAPGDVLPRPRGVRRRRAARAGDHPRHGDHARSRARPEFISGVINLRGRIIPVVDLKRKLGLGDVETAAQLADRRGQAEGAAGRPARRRGLAGPEGARLHHRARAGRGRRDRRRATSAESPSSTGPADHPRGPDEDPRPRAS